MLRKPRIFIASSVESLLIAEAVNFNLDHEFETVLWTGGTFDIGSTALDDLIRKSSEVDFALFIFSPDDLGMIRNEQKRMVRDNVIFEMGLFVGAIGKERTFILQPRSVTMHLPTDLLGVNTADFEADRSDGDLISATNRACSVIKGKAKELGILNYANLSESRLLIANPTNYSLVNQDYKVLAVFLRTHVANPEGLSFYEVSEILRSLDGTVLEFALIKLERMGLIDRSISISQQDGYEFYAYSITSMGIDKLLKHEDIFRFKNPELSFNDEPIPF